MSMERSPKVEQIRFKLWSIRKLPLIEINNALLDLITLNELHHFVPLMRECIRASKEDPYLYRYVRLLDMLLNSVIFNPILNCCLLEFYPRIVHYVHLQGRVAELEQAKKLRKYWARRIHCALFQDLRHQTFRLSGVDVDILSPQDTQDIAKYYVEGLRMSPQQLSYFLPNVAPFLGNYPPFIRGITVPSTELVHRGQLNQKHQRNNALKRGRPNTAQTPKSTSNKPTNQPFINDPPRVLLNDNPNISLFNTPKQSAPNVVKRARQESEETNIGEPDPSLTLRKMIKVEGNAPIYRPITKTHKKQTIKPPLQRVHPKQEDELQRSKEEKAQQQALKAEKRLRQQVSALNLIKKLRSLNEFECRECGTRFQTKQSLAQHTKEHVLIKYQDLKAKQAKKFKSIKPHKNTLKSATEWTSQGLQSSAKCNIVVAVDNQATSKQQECGFCGSRMKVSFVDDDWVYQNTIKTEIVSRSWPKKKYERKASLMHQSCAQEIKKDRQIATKFVSPANN